MVKKILVSIILAFVALSVALCFPRQTNTYELCDEYIINIYRCANNLKPVELDQRLVESALKKAAQLEREKKPWNKSLHDNFGDIINKSYKYTNAGENLAKDFSSDADVYFAWYNSETHRNVMLMKNVEHFGYACVNQYCVLHIGKER